jgi:hypothetical protein
MVMCNEENPHDSLPVAILTIIIFFLCKVDEAGVGKDGHRHQDQQETKLLVGLQSGERKKSGYLQVYRFLEQKVQK